MGPQPHEFFIEMDNPARSFFPGQSITGRVIVESIREKRIEGIKMVFQGKATVRWTESEQVTTGSGENRRSETRTITFHADEDYFDCSTYIIGNGGYEMTIPSGRHPYPFLFTLPNNLPSSFKGLYGQVKYSVTAIMKRSWRLDHKIVLPFTVNGILDLNVEPSAQNAVDMRKHKNVCCLCCKSGPIGFVLQMPKGGYVPGECIQITAEMDNKSTRKVNHTTLSLIQETNFHARGKSKSDARIIAQSLGPSVGEGGSEIWRGSILQIPSIPPSRLGNCRIIDVVYKLKFEMDISGPAVNLKAMVPITIGTIPLRNSFRNLSFHSVGIQENNYNAGVVSPSDPPPYEVYSARTIPSAPAFESYPDLPPPTYFSAIASEQFHPFSDGNERKGRDNKGINGGINASAPPVENGEYLPNYISYGWNTPHLHS